MNFELLANELLLDLFEYLSSIDLLRSFYNLNLRLNHLILIHFQNFTLDFRSISQHDFNLICDQYLPKIANHIRSLRLSNDDDTPQQIDVFLSHGLTIRQFNCLQSLSLCDICSNEIMNNLMLEWQYLPNLTHLTLAGCYLNFNETNAQQLIDSIWSLSNLIYFYLNIYFGEYNIITPTVKSLSLKYLVIWGFEYHQNEINTLFKQTPYLQQFSILLNIDSDNDDIQHSVSSITKLTLSLSRIEEDSITKFFQTTPNLVQLIVDIQSVNIILNGYQWENIIRNYLPNLKIFRFRMEVSTIDKEINDLLDSFRTSFWINEHNWFVRCHWNSDLIYFYTLPYAFDDFHFNLSMKFKSTCPDEKKYLNYDRVNTLGYKNYLIDDIVLSPIRFLNINQLSIELPIHKDFWTYVPKFDQVNSLDVTTDNDNNTEVQDLIDKIPYLYSLNINCLYQLRHISVRRLDLRRYDLYLNDEQCHTLSRSSLGIQCEILFIKIKNRRILVDLINRMINLQTLHIQCEDDKSEDDEIIDWMKDYLPSTCIITRDRIFHSDIRIWIR